MVYLRLFKNLSSIFPPTEPSFPVVHTIPNGQPNTPTNYVGKLNTTPKGKAMKWHGKVGALCYQEY